MSLESVILKALADYHQHVDDWKQCFQQQFPDLPVGFSIYEVPDEDMGQYDELRETQAAEAEALLATVMEYIEAALVTDPMHQKPTRRNEP